MSNGKRYNNANLNSLFERPAEKPSLSGAGGGVVRSGMLILQGHRSQVRLGGRAAVGTPWRGVNHPARPLARLASLPTPEAAGGRGTRARSLGAGSDFFARALTGFGPRLRR